MVNFFAKFWNFPGDQYKGLVSPRPYHTPENFKIFAVKIVLYKCERNHPPLELSSSTVLILPNDHGNIEEG